MRFNVGRRRRGRCSMHHDGRARGELDAYAQAKAELVRRARAAGMDLTGWMLVRLLPRESIRLRALVRDPGGAGLSVECVTPVTAAI